MCSERIRNRGIGALELHVYPVDILIRIVVGIGDADGDTGRLARVIVVGTVFILRGSAVLSGQHGYAQLGTILDFDAA